MTDINSSIANFAAQNEELLGVLKQTDYAEASLKQQQSYVKDLENESAELAKTIKKLESTTKIEQAEFEKYRDSNIKRFAHKLGGSKGKDKFQSKTEKEEREYYEALEKEHAAKDHKQSIDQALKEAMATRDNYQRDNDTHDRAQKDLDALYNSIFAGPNPTFPEEDQAEYRFNQVREQFNAAEQRHRAILQACDLFKAAKKHIALSAGAIDEARSASQWDMFGGGTFADMAERSALSESESQARQAQSAVAHAQRTFPEGVQDMPHFEVAQGSMMSDVIFDSIFTDMAFHDKIKASQEQILRVKQYIEDHVNSLNQHLAGQKQDLDNVQVRLTDARKYLQDTRTRIFAQVNGQPPPVYQP